MKFSSSFLACFNSTINVAVIRQEIRASFDLNQFTYVIKAWLVNYTASTWAMSSKGTKDLWSEILKRKIKW